MTIPPNGSDDATSGDLNITANVTVTGAGSASTTVSGNSTSRLFSVEPGASLSLSGLTLRQGNPTADTYPASTATGYEDGGAIYTDGGLTVTGDVAFKDNTANNGSYDAGAIFADTASTVSLTGAMFENNNGYYGGAIADQSNNTMTIKDSSFVSNGSADYYGGAISNYQGAGALNVDSSTFTSNSAGDGGAIYWDAAQPLSVTHSTFNGNSGYEGGAVYVDEYAISSVTLDYDSFLNNSGNDGGGALYLDAYNSNTESTTLDHDLFKGNNATDWYGGAVQWDEGTLSSSDSTYVDNNAGYFGGGAIYADSGYLLTLVNDTMSHNGGTNGANFSCCGGYTQNYGGGALDIDTPTPATLTNDTITDNSAYQGHGGGIYQTGNLTTGSGGSGIENTVIADNNGGDCDAQFTAPFDLGHNMDSDGTCFSTSVQSSDKPNTEPGLGNPADNGGPLVGNQTDNSAQTILTDAETSGSATVDAGTNSGCPATDERGVSRPQGTSCDIGAFELAAATLTVKKSGPAKEKTKSAFDYTITVSNSGPGYSTGTTVVDRLPSGETLWGTSPSQGSCTSSGSPAKVTCSLGTIAPGSSASVRIVASESKTGTFKNTATATNSQGASASGSVSTKFAAATSGTKPKAITGAATGITKSSAKLHGHVRPEGQRASYFFQYRVGRSGAWRVSVLRHTTRYKAVAIGISHLRSGTTYHYRLVAINGAGTGYGRIRTFRTRGKVSASFTG